jgi:hypothetical protein
VRYYEQQAPGPVSGIEDLLVSILERGLVFVVRLSGEPGDRRLMVGVGLPESVDPVLLALGAAGVFRRPDPDAEWWQ